MKVQWLLSRRGGNCLRLRTALGVLEALAGLDGNHRSRACNREWLECQLPFLQQCRARPGCARDPCLSLALRQTCFVDLPDTMEDQECIVRNVLRRTQSHLRAQHRPPRSPRPPSRPASIAKCHGLAPRCAAKSSLQSSRAAAHCASKTVWKPLKDRVLPRNDFVAVFEVLEHSRHETLQVHAFWNRHVPVRLAHLRLKFRADFPETQSRHSQGGRKRSSSSPSSSESRRTLPTRACRRHRSAVAWVSTPLGRPRGCTMELSSWGHNHFLKLDGSSSRRGNAACGSTGLPEVKGSRKEAATASLPN